MPGLANRSAWTLLCLWLTLQPAGTLEQEVIRSSVTLVPVDVRVLDRNGRSVTDLTADDFTILENGTPQPLKHFSHQALASLAEPMRPTLQFRQSTSLEASPRQHRTFLLFIGRGRMQDVVKGIDGAIEFVRHRLLPQDFVGVAAYNRATDMTADRAAVVAVLSALRSQHTTIEAALDQYFGVAQIVYGSPAIPAHIQRQIDAVFETQGAPRARQMPPALPVAGEPRDGLQRVIQETEQGASGADLAAAKEGYDDLLNLYMGIEYLRHVEGEKHLIHLTERGLVGLRSSEEPNSLASLAADARVAIHTIQVGGVSLRFRADGFLVGRTPAETWAYADGRAVSERTGGLSSFYASTEEAFRRIDMATRSGYMLAYAPAAPWDGRYRKIEVKVRRRGMTALFRHGYVARQDVRASNRTEFLTSTRIASAAAHTSLMADLPLTLQTSLTSHGANGHRLRVDISIPRRSIHFVQADGYWRARLVVAAFVGGRGQAPIATPRQDVALQLSNADYQRLKEEDASVEITLDLDRRPAQLKVVVYEQATDRLGSAAKRIS